MWLQITIILWNRDKNNLETKEKTETHIFITKHIIIFTVEKKVDQE